MLGSCERREREGGDERKGKRERTKVN